MTLTDVTWDDADGARLRAAQQAEIALRYGSDAGAPTGDGTGVPGPTDEAAHGVDPTTVVAAVMLRVDDEPVGFGALRDISGDDDPSGIVHAPGTAELKRLYVATGHRGRGLSRILLRALEARAFALGMRRIVLETGTQQPESMGLYLGEGYLPIEQYGEFWGEPDSRCFAKDLPLPIVVTRAAWDDPAGRDLRARFQTDEVEPLYPHLGEAAAAAGGFDAVDAVLGDRVVDGVVARRDGIVVGCGSLAMVAAGTDDEDGLLEVVKVYVTPEARRWGVARAVMNELVTIARDRGARRLILVTGVWQPAAVTLYRSLGFRPVYPFGEHAGSATALFFALDL
ncbi:GNAT family N-acetyltransferase [Sanguibacter massiliensis]|uniref:GNAT family N-acetyltransferase n=1 Tax=Sanguibacter massiliensis TaxID=1973217 RepID=UPI0013EB1668|nr:GNAT family N-acetyltransferase [Sanguibacter massiliensis]